MGLDITFKQRTKNVCSHCGKEIAQTYDVDSADSGGRCWYPFLKSIGYYVPYDKRTEENDWYGKDMVLTKEQTDRLFRFCRSEEVYNCHMIAAMVAVAEAEGDEVVINADW